MPRLDPHPAPRPPTVCAARLDVTPRLTRRKPRDALATTRHRATSRSTHSSVTSRPTPRVQRTSSHAPHPTQHVRHRAVATSVKSDAVRRVAAHQATSEGTPSPTDRSTERHRAHESSPAARRATDAAECHGEWSDASGAKGRALTTMPSSWQRCRCPSAHREHHAPLIGGDSVNPPTLFSSACKNA